MNLTCNIVEDLLPLYIDEVCSEESRKAVQEHLCHCKKCREQVENSKNFPLLSVSTDPPTEERIIRKSFRKIRVRWLASLLCILFLFPIGLLARNQIRDRGLHFTNLHEYFIGKAFMNRLQEGSYDEAYEYINLEDLREEWIDRWFEEETLQTIEADGKEKFCEYGNKLEDIGGIQSYHYLGITLRSENGKGGPVYELIYQIKMAEGKELFSVYVSDEGVEGISGGGSFLDDPLARFSIWAEYLWQDYAGCYFDPETKEYIYDQPGE